MRKIVVSAMAVLFVLSLSAVCFARMGMKRAMEEMAVKQVEGEVIDVNEKEQAITVQGMRGDVTVVCDNYRTSVRMMKEVRTCADVKKGDKVTLTFEVDQGKNNAKVIAIAPPPEEEQKEEKK
jgi:hypothetical protein